MGGHHGLVLVARIRPAQLNGRAKSPQLQPRGVRGVVILDELRLNVRVDRLRLLEIDAHARHPQIAPGRDDYAGARPLQRHRNRAQGRRPPDVQPRGRLAVIPPARPRPEAIAGAP